LGATKEKSLYFGEKLLTNIGKCSFTTAANSRKNDTLLLSLTCLYPISLEKPPYRFPFSGSASEFKK